MSAGTNRTPGSSASRERRRNRLRAPFGDEDIPIVFAGSGGRDLFHRRLASSRETALLLDDRMLLHKNEWFPSHPECPERVTSIIERLNERGLLRRCIATSVEAASDDVLMGCHENAFVASITDTATMEDEQRKTFASKLDAVYFNEHTPQAARLAAGAVVQAVDFVHRGDIRNAFCLVRPPGHHAMENEACGFCIFNNVAIAASYALEKLEYNRILIVDWDVHHGQATQYMFYDDPRVLFVSIHRYDDQNFWPNLRESNFDFIGSGRGRGYNVNVPLNTEDVGDAEYLAIFHQLIMPMAYEFDPDLILVSAGYDCAFGCPLGNLNVSPSLFAHLTHMLMSLAEGKLIVALEGGYYRDSLAESVAHTISALLGDPMPSLDPLTEVNPSVLKSIADCVSVLRYRWRSLHLFQLAELVPAPDLNHIPDRSWANVKVPGLEPEEHIHEPDIANSIGNKMKQLKRDHPVARNATVPRTCLVYDSRMENHKNEEDRSHPETPHRIRRAYELLDEYGLARRCKRVEARNATREELLRVHTEAHVDRIAQTAGLDQAALDNLAQEEDSIYFNRHTYNCALLAAGSVLSVVDEVCSGQSLNGIALVRPPGHHALPDRCMGFCYFNNIAIAALHAQHVYGLERIAIVDWDVHHGNGTKKVFEENPNILFISVHRFDDGRFFPNSSDGSPNVCGVGEGVGRTIQVAWNGRHVRDGEYIAVFTHLVLPVLYEFRPQLILVSAGFDATRGDRLGGLNLSVECFAHLTHMLLSVAYLNPCSQQRTSSADSNPESSTRVTRARQQEDMRANFSGGLILALEGGYHLATTAEAICHSVSSLLGDCCPRLSVALAPSERGCKAIRKTLSVQEKYWKQIQGFGPLRSPLVCDDPNRINSPNRSRVGSYPAMALTGQLEAEIQSRLEELSLSDVPAPHATTLNHLSNTNTTRPVSTNSASLFTPDPVGLTSLSNSVATTSVTARQTDLGSPITLTQVPDQPNGPGGGTDYSITHATGTNEQIGSISMEAHSSSTTLVGPSTLPPNVDELAHLRIGSPYTGQSDRSSLASELSPNPHFRFTTENTAGLSGSSDAPSTTVPLSDSVGNPVVAVATLQDLMDLGNISTEDIHAFFGLRSTQQLPQRLFAVTPLPWCPHLTSVQINPDWSPNVNETCGRCENELENWVCLNCYAVYCGRYANSHMLEHFSSMRHPLVLSFADLSSWCYECEAYIHNESLLEVKRAVHRAKFGMDMPRV